ncbi:response regulator [Pedobacter sp. SD-b]|uniref:Response regulator n=1 Tax=Pedobacter segetis TaxID=2793069 RepID=A0ABS1BK87_9SPHI|nr:response regulator [Pedobacter segetis]MBK0383310.1 response regulator [Pedobacter segetis]
MSKKVQIAFIIDDDEVYIYAIRRLIKIQNLCDEILVFTDGQQAVDYLSEHKDDISRLPDVIMIDVNMPILDGWGFIDEFQKMNITETKPMKLFMISSSIDSRDVKKAKEIAIIEKYIFKPITFEELKEVFS